MEMIFCTLKNQLHKGSWKRRHPLTAGTITPQFFLSGSIVSILCGIMGQRFHDIEGQGWIEQN